MKNQQIFKSFCAIIPRSLHRKCRQNMLASTAYLLMYKTYVHDILFESSVKYYMYIFQTELKISLNTHISP